MSKRVWGGAMQQKQLGEGEWRGSDKLQLNRSTQSEMWYCQSPHCSVYLLTLAEEAHRQSYLTPWRRRELTDIADHVCLMASAVGPSAVLIPEDVKGDPVSVGHNLQQGSVIQTYASWIYKLHLGLEANDKKSSKSSNEMPGQIQPCCFGGLSSVCLGWSYVWFLMWRALYHGPSSIPILGPGFKGYSCRGWQRPIFP